MQLLAGSLVRIRVQQTQYVVDEQKGSDILENNVRVHWEEMISKDIPKDAIPSLFQSLVQPPDAWGRWLLLLKPDSIESFSC